MTKEEVEVKLIQGIASIISKDVSEVVADKPFHDLGVDSLGFIEILVYIEKTFKLQLIAADLTKKDFETVQSLASFISRKL